MNSTRCTERKRKKKKATKLKGLFSKLLVVFILAQVLIYTYLNMWLSYRVGMEISPTLTASFFAFFGFEAGMLGMIKTNKIKKGEENNEGTNYSEIDES